MVRPLPGCAWTAGPCTVCGTLFLSPHFSDRTCSPECRKLHQSRLDAARRARRRACSLDSARVEVFSHEAIYARDGFTCQLCSEPVDMTTADPDMKPTLDHRVPLSKGGLHVSANVQLAHSICNQYKRDLTGKKARKAVQAGLERRARRRAANAQPAASL